MHLDNGGRGWQVDLTNANITGDLDLEEVTCIGATSVAGATISGQVNLVGAKLGRRLPPGEKPTGEPFSYSAFTALYCIIVFDQYAGRALAGVFVAAVAGFLKRT